MKALITLLICLAFGAMASQTVTESFESASFPPPGWSASGATRTSSYAFTGYYSVSLSNESDFIQTYQLSNPDSLSFYARKSGNGNARVVVHTSTDGFVWAERARTGSLLHSWRMMSYDVSSLSNIYIRFMIQSPAQTPAYIDDIKFSTLSATPLIQNLHAIQSQDTFKSVDIAYDLLHNLNCAVQIYASSDNGATWSLPINHVSGDVGSNIIPGNGKHIVWDVLAEHPDMLFEQLRIKVVADDGQPPPGFVFVPSGTFTMGRTTGAGSDNELPTHSVTLNSFFIGKYEVTQAEWTSIMGSNPASGFGVGDNYPIYNVSWYAILKYCNLRSINEGVVPVYSISGSTDPATWGYVPTSNNVTWNAAVCNWGANGYRLPTEAEWEYAARGGTHNPDYLYSGNIDINAVAWYIGNNTPIGSKPVGTKAHNGLGIYDMSGNVYEWCWDWYSSSYYGSSPANNPTGPTSGSYRVLRGGFWNTSDSYCRVASRYNYEGANDSSGDSNNGYRRGFRLCRTTL